MTLFCLHDSAGTLKILIFPMARGPVEEAVCDCLQNSFSKFLISYPQ